MRNLLANLRTHLQSRTQVHSFRFALIYLRPCITLHPPTVNRQFRAQLFQAGKSDKITFSKIKFFTLKNRENTCFLINYGISVKENGEITSKRSTSLPRGISGGGEGHFVNQIIMFKRPCRLTFSPDHSGKFSQLHFVTVALRRKTQRVISPGIASGIPI